jgi:hypothetical protein
MEAGTSPCALRTMARVEMPAILAEQQQHKGRLKNNSTNSTSLL